MAPVGGFVSAGRGPKMFGCRSDSKATTIVIATVSTLVIFGLVFAGLFFAPGSAAVRRSFFSFSDMWRSFRGNPSHSEPGIGRALWINAQVFLIAEVAILVLALAVAVVRQSRSPILFPFRVIFTIYVDVARGVPLILVIYTIGLGLPALSVHFISNLSDFVYVIIALVGTYTAYVSEVYRAGLNSVHRGQIVAARSLGLSQWTAFRHVTLPQAVRNVVPALLNDFISLQKDTALAGVIGLAEANQAAQIYASAEFNYSSFVVAAFLFVLLTVPLARYTDYLIAKDRRRRLAGVW